MALHAGVSASLLSAKSTILPNGPLFQRLLTIAHSRHAATPLVHDLNANITANAHELLEAVLVLRCAILDALPPGTKEYLQQGQEVFLSLSADGGYDFAVAILAILSINACAVLLSTAMPSRELHHYVSKTRSQMILYTEKGASAATQLVRDHAHSLITFDLHRFRTRVVQVDANRDLLPRITISHLPQADPNGPGIIIFTSGTTGPPKAVAIRRSTITSGAQSLADQLELRPRHRILHTLPVHHATGINLSFFPFLMAGACIEFHTGGFDSRWVWDRFRRGDLTHFTGVPTMYTRLSRFWEQEIANMPPAERTTYAHGVKQLEAMYCGTSALSHSISQFWKSLRDGHPVLQRYGSTETQIAINMSGRDALDVPDGSVGRVSVGVELKIAGSADDTNEGELLVRSPHMFAGYLHDDAATRAAHDADGFFKTGDIVQKRGEYYFILGRASMDILKSGGYKISALDVEREITNLPYIGEVMVVGVPDDEFGQLVAAAVTLREVDDHAPKVTLSSLRDDLRRRLAGYKLPTLLRIVPGELPKNATGKVVKKVLGPLYFPTDYAKDCQVQVWSRRTVVAKI
ncbi:Malonate--CoA ligase [Cyphellophora attinorum]|uniref:Malonate--CoA ligase n=1 Tax=Cyphellophora attinorum TaxID=1664694 RepID=A0A0N1NZC5_9EURO|nr:Malonate--CoA ligase [Phialophora attinorum]KPI38157.1 Malonate--CoA ligase [Phialophora attinorum]